MIYTIKQNFLEDGGADVVKVKGNYEKSLIECIKQSTNNNWQIVQDVAWKDYMTVPKFTGLFQQDLE